jgi:hypothetical protein
VPAASSSLLARLSGRQGHRDQPTPPEHGLVAHLATVPDPRDRRRVRHRLASLLSVAVCAVLAGARSLAAIGESETPHHRNRLRDNQPAGAAGSAAPNDFAGTLKDYLGGAALDLSEQARPSDKSTNCPRGPAEDDFDT